MPKSKIGTNSGVVSAARGKRMIEVKVYFHTDEIAPGRGDILQKNARESGIVQMRGNRTHGISGALAGQHFNSLAELPAAVERALKSAGVVLHP